jgi:hypothetical protein
VNEALASHLSPLTSAKSNLERDDDSNARNRHGHLLWKIDSCEVVGEVVGESRFVL